MSAPKLLDLFCCEGGASVGYARAGFDVHGVDLFTEYRQARYPFGSTKRDVLTMSPADVAGYDAIVASPPCQRYSITNAARRFDYPDLIGPTRALLRASGLPYVIENVVGAPLVDPILLCWTGFRGPGSVVDDDGTPLQMFRHRLFESNVELTTPGCRHDPRMQVAGSYGGARRDKLEARHVRHGGYVPAAPVQRDLLGIDWMTQKGMFQSIPPCYTEHLGRQLMAHLGMVT